MSYQTVVQSAWVEIQPGLELLDNTNTFIADISDNLVSGSITHQFDASIHRTCNLVLDLELQWHSQRLRPYMTIRDETGEEYTYKLGVYLPDTPKYQAGLDPQQFQVTGYDVLSVLATPIGATFEATTSDYLITKIEGLLSAAGVTDYLIDQTAAAVQPPSLFLWEMDERNTYLSVINDMLLAIGYQELYSDSDGKIRGDVWVFPQDKTSIWTYSSQDTTTTMVSEDSVSETDLFDIPNKWVFIRDDPAQTSVPSEGTGLYTVVNQSDGITSIDARNRIITTIRPIKYVSDQTALEIVGDRIVQASKRPQQSVGMNVSPNPIHSHYDVVVLDIPEINAVPTDKYLLESWTLPLEGTDMTLNLRKILT